MCLKSLLLKKRSEFFEYVILIILLSIWTHQNEKNKAPSYKTWSKTFTWNSHCIITNKAVSILHKYLNLLDASYRFNHYSIWLKQIPIYYWYSCEGEIELFPLCCVSCKIVKRFAASAKGWRNLIGLSRELLPSLFWFFVIFR